MEMRLTDIGGIAGDRLRSFIERIERLREEKRAIAADEREVFEEAKATGFDTKIMRRVLTLRAMDATTRQEQEQIEDLYRNALGIETRREVVEVVEVDPRLGRAAELFRHGKTVRAVATALGISPATAGRLRQQAEAGGLLVSCLTDADETTGGETEPPHDPETGEIIAHDRPGTPTGPAAGPDSPDAECADRTASTVNAAPAAARQGADIAAANPGHAAPIIPDTRIREIPPLTPEEQAMLDIPESMRRTA